MRKIILIICLFIFNITTLNSNSSKELLYNNKLSYEEKNYKIYFINTNSKELSKVLKYSNIKILSYIIDDKKYYARNIEELENIYTKDMNLSDKIYYEHYGIKIDGINIMSNTYELKYLEDLINIY